MPIEPSNGFDCSEETWQSNLAQASFIKVIRITVEMRGKQIVVIMISLALLLAGLVALRRLREKPIRPSVSETSRLIGGRAFEVQVEMPAFNSGRAPWEIPGAILGYDPGPRFDQASPGAQVGKMAPDHIELRADGGWDLLIGTDAEGRLTHETHVAFPVKLGGRPLKFNCQPADPNSGYLHTTARPDSDELEGDFQLEIAICKNAASGKTAAWPYKPLKVRGNFAGLRKQGSSELLPTPGTGLRVERDKKPLTVGASGLSFLKSTKLSSRHTRTMQRIARN